MGQNQIQWLIWMTISASKEFNRNANFDGMMLKSTNAIVFNNVIKNYNYDTLYDLNQRGANVEEGIIPKTIKVHRNLFQNGATKNTGASWHNIEFTTRIIFTTILLLVGIGYSTHQCGSTTLLSFQVK